MNHYQQIFKENCKFKTFLLSILITGLAYGLYKGMLDNFLVEIVGMSEMDRGITEFFREVPGILIVFILAAFYMLSAETLYNLVNPSYYGQITLNGQSHPKNYYVVCDNWSLSTEINGSYGESQIVSTNNGILNFNVMPMRGFNMNDYSRYVLLFVIKVNKVNFTVTKISNLETDPNTF